MSLSRWKMMAGALGVSIGGLAAAASQCPKLDMSKGRSPDAPVAKAEPKVPPAGAPSIPLPPVDLPSGAASSAPLVPASPPLPPGGPLLGTPALPAAPASMDVIPLPSGHTAPAMPDLKAPKLADVTPTGGTLPPLPGTPSAPTGAKTNDSKSSVPFSPTSEHKSDVFGLPPVPAKTNDSKSSVPLPPAAAPTPGDLIPPPPVPAGKPTAIDGSKSMPPSGPDGRGLFGTPMFTGPGGELLPLNSGKPTTTQPVGSPPVTNLEKQPLITPVVGSSSAQQVASPPSSGALTPLPPQSSDLPPPPADVPQSKPTFTPPAAAPVAEAKFRIILRVGEGEPTFEVKNNDNLVLKVVCEKVDIESVEKGTGLSKVTARGKVRFVGFGAEGSCESLSFIAGTGEVQMNGEVKVQVKDKLGRVESELTTAAMKYKIDASAVGGSLKP